MNFPKLRTVLDQAHPVTGAYNADHAAAADQLNAKNVAAPEGHLPVTVRRVWQYLINQIDGTGGLQRGTVALLEEYAELGTVRGAAPARTMPRDSRRPGRSGGRCNTRTPIPCFP